jgi:predicted GNAT family acetyltransferase
MEIKNDTNSKKFTSQVEGGEAYIIYRRGPENAYELVSTLVPPPARGHNVADQLVRMALETAKREQVKIIATCPYVRSWFKKHPSEQAILQSPLDTYSSPSAAT